MRRLAAPAATLIAGAIIGGLIGYLAALDAYWTDEEHHVPAGDEWA